MSITLEPDSLIEWCRCGRQEVEEGANLRQVTRGLFDDRFARSRRRAVQRLAYTELPIPPALNRKEEERAIGAVDNRRTTFSEARQMKWATNRSA